MHRFADGARVRRLGWALTGRFIRTLFVVLGCTCRVDHAAMGAEEELPHWPVEVRVVDKSGAPVTYVSVTLWSSTGVQLAEQNAFSDGRVRWEKISAFPLVATVTLLGVPSKLRGRDPSIELRERSPPAARIVVDIEPRLVVRPLAPTGEPVEASSDARRLTLPDLRSSAGADQRWMGQPVGAEFVFQRVPVRKDWSLFISSNVGLGGTAYVSGPRLSAGSMEVRLEVGKPIAGRIRADFKASSGGGRQPMVPRIWTQRGLHRIPGVLARDGSFHFQALPAGRWTLEASFIVAAGPRRIRIEADAGEEALRIDEWGHRE